MLVAEWKQVSTAMFKHLVEAVIAAKGWTNSILMMLDEQVSTYF
jgi:hypothetical protein